MKPTTQHDKSNVKFKIGCFCVRTHAAVSFLPLCYTSTQIIFHDFIIALIQMPKANSYNASHSIVIIFRRFVAFFPYYIGWWFLFC